MSRDQPCSRTAIEEEVAEAEGAVVEARPKVAPPKNSSPMPPPIMLPSSSWAPRQASMARRASELALNVFSVELKPAGVEGTRR
jgi:hypothetical protein